MNVHQLVIGYIALAFVAANLPWLSGRVFLWFSPRQGKAFFWYLAEWLVLYLVAGIIGFGLERAADAQVQGQGWEFYAIALCMFAVFAIPGFIWRFNVLPLLRGS